MIDDTDYSKGYMHGVYEAITSILAELDKEDRETVLRQVAKWANLNMVGR